MAADRVLNGRLTVWSHGQLAIEMNGHVQQCQVGPRAPMAQGAFMADAANCILTHT